MTRISTEVLSGKAAPAAEGVFFGAAVPTDP
jgi:hypothetical protein